VEAVVAFRPVALIAVIALLGVGCSGDRTAGTAEGGERVSFDIGRLALVAIAVALWVAVFQGFNAF
jgi:hypothetical protein